MKRIVSRGELVSQQYIWSELFAFFTEDDSIPRVLSSLLLQGCGINTRSCTMDVLRSLSKWDLWNLYLPPSGGIDIAHALSVEAQSIIRLVRRVVSETIAKIEKSTLLVSEASVLSSNLGNIEKHFDKATILKLKALNRAVQDFNVRRAGMQSLLNFFSLFRADCLPGIKHDLALDPQTLTLVKIMGMFQVQGDEAEMLEILPSLGKSECFRYILRNTDWSAEVSTCLSAFCESMWKPCLKAWGLLVCKVASASITLKEVLERFQIFSSSELIKKEISIMETWSRREGSPDGDDGIPKNWSEPVEAAVNFFFRLRSLVPQSTAILKLIHSLRLEQELQDSEEFRALRLVAVQGEDYLAQPLSFLKRNIEHALEPLTKMSDHHVECLLAISDHEKLISWLQENEAASPEEFGQLIQVLTGCVEEPQDLERVSAMHSVHSRLYGICCLSTSTEKKIFQKVMAQASELDVSHDLCEKIFQCSQDLEWFDLLRKKAGEGVGAESIQKMLDFLERGQLAFRFVDGSVNIEPNLGDLRDVHSRVALLLPPDDCEFSGKLFRFGKILALAENAERDFQALIENGSTRLALCGRDDLLHDELENYCSFLQAEQVSWTQFLESQRATHFWINLFSIRQLAKLASCARNARLDGKRIPRIGKSDHNRLGYDTNVCDVLPDDDDEEDPQVKFLAEMMNCSLKIAREAWDMTNDVELAIGFIQSNSIPNQLSAASIVEEDSADAQQNADDEFVLSALKCIDPEITLEDSHTCLEEITDTDVMGNGWLDSIESLLNNIGSKRKATPIGHRCASDSVLIGKISLRSDIPPGRTIEFLLSMFCNLNSDPNPETVLLCNKGTSFEAASLMVRRAFSCFYSSKSRTQACPRGRGTLSTSTSDMQATVKPVYCLAGVERLETTVHDQLADLIQRIINEEGEYRKYPAPQDFRFVIICEGSCRLAGRLTEMSCTTLQKSLPPVDMGLIASSQTWAKRVKAIFSQAGTGKSAQARRIASEAGLMIHTIILRNSNLCELVSNLVTISRQGSNHLILLHMEVSEIFKGDLDAVLFDLLVVGILKASNGQIWHRASVSEVVLEIPSELKFSSQILSLVHEDSVACTPREIREASDALQDSTPTQKHLYCIGKSSAGKYNLDPSVWSNSCFQRAARYLYYHQHNLLEKSDPLEDTTAAPYICSVRGLPAHECLVAILDAIKIISDDSDPSWEAFTVFWKFFGSEAARFSENCFLQTCFSNDLPGFRELVFGQLLVTGRDFVTNSIHSNHDVGVAPAIQRYAPRKVWGQQNLSYIITHQDYFAFFNLRVADRGLPARPGEITLSEDLFSAFNDYKIEMNPNYHSRSRTNLMRDLAGILDVPIPASPDELDPDAGYILTLDNMKKMMAIHLRLRADLPVLIQGETGCGKTLLVRYLVSFIKACFKNMRVHGGTTAEDIRRCIHDAEAEAKNGNQTVVIFFDEINCASHMDMFKKIVCDRCLDGLPLSPKLKVIAACNPYLKLSQSAIDKQEAMGLGFRSVDLESLDGIPLRHLVYRVSKLPDSMLYHLWDFGTLTEEVESTYIRLIVNSESSLTANSNEASCFSSLIHASQIYLRQLGDESSFVSMRDYRERAIPVFKFFSSFLIKAKPDIDILASGPVSAYSRLMSSSWSISDCVRSMFLSLFVAYESRMNDPKHRLDYRQHIAQQFLSSHGSKLGAVETITSSQLANEMENEVNFFQELLLSEMKLPEGIASCSMLKENVMMMAICIQLNIPLFLVGKPGTSKSLAKKLVGETMKGNRSCGRLFRHLKSVTMFSYQCSPHSTSEDIQSVWDKAVRFLERKDKETFTAVVVLDEIGLAEDSSLMPLKVLHPLLERPSIGFIGLSNWAIDPAKMNRGVFVSRSDPDKEDLIRTALGITHDVPNIQLHVSKLTDLYLHIYENCQPRRDFYGLRDFFSMIKMLRFAVKFQGGNVSFSLLKKIVERNFGGSDQSPRILEYFAQNFSEQFSDISPENSLTLISSCLERVHHKNASGRYLLIQTQNPDAALQVLYNHSGLDKREVDVISGSNFPNDRGFGVICGHLRKVRLCMATDRTLVCKDLEACLEALYDLLNQFFSRILGKRWVDIGLGNERMQCPVGDQFRVIILAKDDQVASFPIPLLNRLEKHRLRIEDILDSRDHQIVAKLLEKLCKCLRHNSTKSRIGITDTELLTALLPGYYTDTIPSLVAWKKQDRESEQQVASLECFLINIATPEFVLLSKNDEFQNCYFEKQNHACLSDFIRASIGPCTVKACRAIVTTYDTLPSQGTIKEQVVSHLCDAGIVEVRYLEDFKTQTAFEFALRDLRKKCEAAKHNILVLMISSSSNSGIIGQSLQMLEAYTSADRDILCHVVVVLKLQRSLSPEKRYHLIFDSTWDHVYMDSLVPQWVLPEPSIWDFWRAGHLSTLCAQLECRKQSILTDILQANLQHAMARLATSHTQAPLQPLNYIRTLQQVLSDELLAQVVEGRVMQILSDREKRAVSPNFWIENLCQNHGACLSIAGTLSRAIKAHVETQISAIFTTLLANLACDGGFEMIDAITSDAHDSYIKEKRSIWIAVVASGADCSQPIVPMHPPTEDPLKHMVGVKSYGRSNPFISKFPLSWAVYKALDGMMSSSASKGGLTVLSARGLIVSNRGLSNIFGQVTSQSLIDFYIHDFVRMAYLPAYGSQAEFKVIESMLHSECCRQDLGLPPYGSETKPDVPTAFASIHSAWLRSDFSSIVLHLRAIFLEQPKLAECFASALSQERIRSAEFTERLALEQTIRVLTPSRETLAQRDRVSSWTASVRNLAPIAEAIIGKHRRDAVFSRSARNGYDRIRIAAAYAEMLYIDSWHDIASFWEQVLRDPEFFSSGSLKRIIRFLVSREQSLASQPASAESGSFVAKLIDDFFGDDFVTSDELLLNVRFEIQLVQGSGQKSATVHLSPKSRVSIIRRLIDMVYSGDSIQPIRIAAEARLEKLLSRGASVESRKEAVRVIVRACEDFVALRSGSSQTKVISWAREFLPRSDAPAHHLFGIVCAQACLTDMVDVIFAAHSLVSVEVTPAAALCSARSSYREACQRFLAGQVLRRFGLRALYRLASHPKLQWVKSFVEPAMLIDRADLFLVHGAAYAHLRDQQLLRRPLGRSSDPALCLLALFNDATASALEPARHQPDVRGEETEAATDPAKPLLVDQGRACLSGVSCEQTMVQTMLVLLERVQSNTLGGAEAGLHRAVLTLGDGQSEAGALLHQLVVHITVAAAVGGSLVQPLRDLVLAPSLMLTRYVPAAPSFEELRATMQGTTEATRWYICPNGHPYAVGECGRFNAGGRCICGAAIGGVRGYGTEQAADLAPPNFAEDERGFPGAIQPMVGPCRILSGDEAAQQAGWAEPSSDRWGAQRGLTASAAAALRVLMHALLLAGAATCPRRAVEAAALLKLQVDHAEGESEDGGDRIGGILAALTGQLCAEIVCLRQLVACSPEDTAVLLHCACQRIIETARAEQGGDSGSFDLATQGGRAAWENAFARRVLSPVLEAAESTVALHRAALGKARSSHRRLRDLLEGGEDSAHGRAWAYRAPVTLDLCHRHLERVSTDARHLPVLRGYLSGVRLLRHLRHLLPVARLCAALCGRYGRAVMTVAEARGMRIGEVLRGPDGDELAAGVAAFRAAWAGLREDMQSLIPAAVAGFLGRVLAAPPEEYGLGGGAAGFGALGDDTPLTFFLPDETREGVCAVALLVALVRVQNLFLDSQRETLLSRYGAHVDPAPVPLAQLGPDDVLGCRVRREILPLLLAAAEHVPERGRPAGEEAVHWDMEGLEKSLVGACVFGRRVIDETSIPRAAFVGHVCDGAALEASRRRPVKAPAAGPVAAGGGGAAGPKGRGGGAVGRGDGCQLPGRVSGGGSWVAAHGLPARRAPDARWRPAGQWGRAGAAAGARAPRGAAGALGPDSGAAGAGRRGRPVRSRGRR